MKKLVILGSCASRDALDYDASGQFELVAYYARSSLASLVSPPFVDEDAVARITSKFQRRMVRKDMAKNLWRELPALDFDLLLLDLIDERFPLLQFPDGARHTLSAEYAAVRDDGQGAVETGADSAEKQDLWQKG